MAVWRRHYLSLTTGIFTLIFAIVAITFFLTNTVPNNHLTTFLIALFSVSLAFFAIAAYFLERQKYQERENLTAFIVERFMYLIFHNMLNNAKDRVYIFKTASDKQLHIYAAHNIDEEDRPYLRFKEQQGAVGIASVSREVRIYSREEMKNGWEDLIWGYQQSSVAKRLVKDVQSLVVIPIGDKNSVLVIDSERPLAEIGLVSEREKQDFIKRILKLVTPLTQYLS